MGVIARFKKWRKYNKETTANRIKAESYYNKAFIELKKLAKYTIVFSAIKKVIEYITKIH